MSVSKTSSVVHGAIRLWLKVSDADHFEAATWQPAEIQQRKLLEIVRRNRATEYGREHGFDRVRSVEDFQRNVPRNTYETLMPYITRMTGGEQNVLTADAPLMFATTSGTTGRAKYIPVTPSYLQEYSHAIHVHTYRVLADHPDILGGKTLTSVSSDREGVTEGGIPYGAISGYLNRTQPASLRKFYSLPQEIGMIKDIDRKYYLTLRHGLADDIRYLATPNPSSLLLLASKMESYADELIHDIRTGTVNSNYLPENAPADLTASLRADPARADELAAIVRRTGRLLPADAWPNLRVISCWKGGTMPLYLSKLSAYYGNCHVRDFGYMASEGRGSTPLVNAGAGGVLSVTSHFLEFLPEEQRDDPDAPLLTCEQLQANQQYYVFLTTSAGMYRYDINDVVRVVDFYHRTPVIEFVRKGQGISSITGEKLTESQVTAAVLSVVKQYGFNIEHFTACVEWGEPPRYAFYAEVGDGMDTTACRQFLLAVDRALYAQNIEYESKRESQRLGPLVMKRVAPGSYQRLRQQRVAEGAPEAQVKIPHLSTNMKFGERLDVVEEIRVGAEDMP
jgi:GH3 auxin-responsive promoter